MRCDYCEKDAVAGAGGFHGCSMHVDIAVHDGAPLTRALDIVFGRDGEREFRDSWSLVVSRRVRAGWWALKYRGGVVAAIAPRDIVNLPSLYPQAFE